MLGANDPNYFVESHSDIGLSGEKWKKERRKGSSEEYGLMDSYNDPGVVESSEEECEDNPESAGEASNRGLLNFILRLYRKGENQTNRIEGLHPPSLEQLGEMIVQNALKKVHKLIN